MLVESNSLAKIYTTRRVYAYIIEYINYKQEFVYVCIKYFELSLR